jgi:hypothetical protein
VDTEALRVTTTQALGSELRRLQNYAVIMLGAGAVLMVVGALMNVGAAAQAYLFSFMFWLGVSAGSLGLLMLNHTVGGGWGFTIRRFLEAGARMLPVVGLMFVPVILTIWLRLPVLFGAELPPPGVTHGWAHPAAGSEAIIRDKSVWLNPLGFTIRAVLYFAIWIWFANRLIRLGSVLDTRTDHEAAAKLNVTGAAGILVYVLTMTFASVDWVMSLKPDWVSSIFGLLTVASQGLATLALMLVLLGFFAAESPLIRSVPSRYFRDLGNLTLAGILLWAYMAFSQYLINFSGNTVEEAPWYIARTSGGWQYISATLIVLHFAAPFLILLIGSRVKRDPRRLAVVAMLILVMRLVDLFWLVAPNFRTTLWLNPADLGAPLLLGGIWLFLWANQVKDKPVVPLYDPRFVEHMAHAHEPVAHGKEAAEHA